jgi:SSS family solute:Na+ symporter
MTVFGLHLVDLVMILVFLVVMIWLGYRTWRQTKSITDFFLAGRKLGRFYQFFLNFGVSTNADQAVAVSREVYRQGVGGMWIQFLVLFLTPFYWFSTLFFRRVRLTTIGDFFTDRLRSRFLGGFYAVFILLFSIVGGGVGYLVASKTMIAMTPKPLELCTPTEKASVMEFQEFQSLKTKLDKGLTEEENTRYEVLLNKNNRGELKSFISYTNEMFFYIIYAVIVGVYTMLGGFKAAAITDAIQGFFILIFSIILIPVGLARIGGFSGLHAQVPDYKFVLFGSATMSEYAWYTVVAMVLSNLVSIIAVASGMQTAGSAKNEMTARVGMIGGMFTKRIMMIFWVLAGLIAIGLYADKLHDPDLIWGYMTHDLLVPGAIGLMLIGILAANMSTLSASSVSYSALFIRNIYEPLLPGKSEGHYMLISRLVIGLTLLGGIGVAIYVNNLLELFKYIISIPAIFGASIWLGFIWRRLSHRAVILQVSICIIIYAIIPNLFQNMDAFRRNPAFLQQTEQREVKITTRAVETDVKNGLAAVVGQKIEKVHIIAPSAIYFEKVARANPSDPASPQVGLERFHAEIWVLSWFGIDFTRFTKPQLVAVRFLFDALFPFVLLILLSLITRPEPKEHLDRFFAKMHTPIQPTDELETAALEESYRNPGKFEKEKIFPGSQWELMKPKKIDYLGFGGSWILVGVVILLLWFVLSIK